MKPSDKSPGELTGNLMHALLLVRNDFCREDGWYDPRVMNCAKGLLRGHWRVTVVCDQKSPKPRGDVFQGMTIMRVLWHRQAGLSKSMTWLQRILRQVPLLSSLNHQFCLEALPALSGRLAEQPVHLVVANDVEMLPLGLALAKRKKARLVYDSHEYHASRAFNVIPRDANGYMRTLVYKAVQKYCVPKAHLVTTVSKPIALRLQEDHPRLQAGVKVIHNYPPLPAAKKNDFIRQHYKLPTERKIIIYVGGLQVGRGCRMLVRLAPRLLGATLFFLGDGPLRRDLEQMASGLPAGKVIFHGMVPQGAVAHITASADIGACLLSPDSLSHQMAAPNKIFIYMQAGIPSVVSNFPELERLVVKPGLGVSADPLDDEAVLSALVRLLANAQEMKEMGLKAVRAFEQCRNWDGEQKRLQDLYRNVMQ